MGEGRILVILRFCRVANFNYVNARGGHAVRHDGCAFVKVNNCVYSVVLLLYVGIDEGRAAYEAVGGRSIRVELQDGENGIMLLYLLVLTARFLFAFNAFR